MRKSEDNEADIPSGRYETGPHVKLFTKVELGRTLTAGGSYDASHQGSFMCFSNCDSEHARLVPDLPSRSGINRFHSESPFVEHSGRCAHCCIVLAAAWPAM